MSIEDREWFREDWKKRRKKIEKNSLREHRQIGIDAMWNEGEKSRKETPSNSRHQAGSTEPVHKKIRHFCPNCNCMIDMDGTAKRTNTNSCRCPDCKRYITIRCEKPGDYYARVFLSIVGFPLLAVVWIGIISYLYNMLL